ncbi:hypothetical protein [Halapricum desulfuricans]|uniref:Uncharacterized protein n=1 Tax=Halapricum desulfuricans TaxID=2841257 RepID=A0A897N495_9EURY|nr:hypothetical protein [Halapricum desulfuricans]QSG07048.1 Uncharacterized protein HSR121_2728 [Halapricum desulfuricans]
MREKWPGARDRTSIAQLALVGAVLVALVISGPLVPGLSLAHSEPDSLDEGDATVSSVSVDAEKVTITPGRFGANVSYIRVPDAAVAVDGIEGQPRVVYQLSIPELGIDHSEPKLITTKGRTTVGVDPIAVQPRRVTRDSYSGRVTVRVQSFTVDRVQYNESITVEVRR